MGKISSSVAWVFGSSESTAITGKTLSFNLFKIPELRSLSVLQSKHTCTNYEPNTNSFKAVPSETHMPCLLGAEGEVPHNVTAWNTNVFQELTFVNQ